MIVLEFHPETPVKTDTLFALGAQEKDRVRLFPDSRLGYRPTSATPTVDRRAEGALREMV